jgi:pyroglutamyl-peptidase
MFGLAARTRFVRIETLARNAIVALPDAGATVPASRIINAKGPQTRRVRAPVSRLLHAASACAIPAGLSRDAGRYVCNYSYWRALEHAGPQAPRLVVFVHVPKARTAARPNSRKRGSGFAFEDLLGSGRSILLALAAALRHPAEEPAA